MYYKKKVEDVFSDLNTNENGLSNKEVVKRLKEYGFNKINDDKKTSKLSILFRQFKDSMVIMLMIVSIISFIYSYLVSEPYTDSIIIIIIIILNVFMGYFQESRAEASIESLKNMNTSVVKVKRNDKVTLVDSIDLVPGDIIILEAGDKVPADARIIEEHLSKVDESLLTGESVASFKTSEVIVEDALISDRKNMIYSGCNVINGKIIAVVTSTGMNTEIGKIASSIIDKKELPTPLQQKINEISKNLSIIVIFIIALIFIYNILILHNEILKIIMLCISLIVSAVPEGLPAVISISLSLGVNDMAKKNTLIRTLSSIETLGATEVICSDKTGTITKNEMEVLKVFSNMSLFEAKDCVIDEKMLLCMLLCNDSKIVKNKIIGDPTETSLISLSIKKYKKSKEYLEKYKRISEIPFDSDRKMMSTVNEVDNENIMFTKGSLESILNSCEYYEENGNICKLTKNVKNKILKIENELSDNALRVIGFAYKNVSSMDLENINVDYEKKLIFIGMVGMMDPPRENVKESIQTCLEAGITPIMITGDNLNTALAIASQIGLITEKNEGIEGKKLANYSDEEMLDVVKKYKVYARVSPSDKVRIVEAFQKNGKIVAMTGDGVNDAPAIKLAHIGIGMGKTGTEVTKSASDILLLDDCFNTIVAAVKEGRRIYNNIRNVILYSLSSNFAEIFIVIVGLMLGINILLPIHILYIDLVTDAVLAICLAFEKSSKSVMKVPPHKSSNKFFTPFMTTFLIISAVIESLLIYIVYKVGLDKYGIEVAQSMAFLCLIVQEMIFAYSCRNVKEPIIKHGIFTNKYMNIGVVILTLLQIIIFITPLRDVLHIAPLGFDQLMLIIVLNIISFIFIELLKPILSKKLED